MNALVEAPETYESLILPLRGKINAIDGLLVTTLVTLQVFIHHHALWEAVIHTILSDEGFEEHRAILTTILRTLKSIPAVGLSILHHNNLEWDKMNKLLESIHSLLSARFEVVRQVWELKGEYDKPSRDDGRWNLVLADRKEKWNKSWWKNAETIVPNIWNPIHDIALGIEEACKVQIFRRRLSNANSCTESRWILRRLIVDFKDRYIHWLRTCVEQWNTDIAERLSYLLAHTSEGSTVCDIWTYDGFFAHSLSEHWRIVTAIDLLEELISLFQDERSHHNNSQADIIISDFDALAVQSNSFDYTILSHILEHVPNMSSVMDEAIRISKPGGEIIIIVPDKLWNDPTHVRIVTEDDVRQISKSLIVVNWHQRVWNGWGYIFQK